MPVFPRQFVRALPSQDPRYDVPWVVQLCRNPSVKYRVARREIEEWYSEFSEGRGAGDVDLLRRLRSRDSGQHVPALFELFFHHYVHQRGWVENKPLPSRNPDLEVVTSDGFRFTLEVATFVEFQWERRVRQVQETLFRAINTRNPDFAYMVSLRSQGEKRWREVASYIVSRAGSPEFAGHDDFEFDFDFKGTKGRIHGFRNYCGYCGNLPTGPGLLTLNEFSEKVRVILKGKAKKYKTDGRRNRPYVVALCTEHYLIDDDIVTDAMYGSRGFAWNPFQNDSETRLVRLFDGLVTPKPGLGWLAQNTSLSAVIFCKRVVRGNRIVCDLSLFRNPFVQQEYSLPEDLFPDMPQYLGVRLNDNRMGLSRVEPHGDNHLRLSTNL